MCGVTLPGLRARISVPLRCRRSWWQRRSPPAETALLDPNLVLSFITEAGGPTSHVAIIARSLGVAAVVGTTGVVELVSSGDSVALDGTSGDVAIRPNDETTATFTARRDAYVAAQQAAARYRGVRVSLGDRPVAVPANVGSREDIELAIAEGADGIGLLRTEFLFLDRAAAPNEEEQFEFYSFAAQGFDDTVVIRTFDIGGDKPASYLDLAPRKTRSWVSAGLAFIPRRLTCSTPRCGRFCGLQFTVMLR